MHLTTSEAILSRTDMLDHDNTKQPSKILIGAYYTKNVNR